MQRGVRFLEKKRFPCCAGMASGTFGGAWCRPGALPCSVALVFLKKNDSHAAWRSFWAAGVVPAVGQEQHQNTKG